MFVLRTDCIISIVQYKILRVYHVLIDIKSKPTFTYLLLIQVTVFGDFVLRLVKTMRCFTLRSKYTTFLREDFIGNEPQDDSFVF